MGGWVEVKAVVCFAISNQNGLAYFNVNFKTK
jgi:hypothetical protein